MEEGKLYRVGFQRQLGNYQWELAEFIATYLAMNRLGEEEFSLRPHAGTMGVDARSIWYAEKVPSRATGREDPDKDKRRVYRVRRIAKEEVR
jgi:hypothetical protein